MPCAINSHGRPWIVYMTARLDITSNTIRYDGVYLTCSKKLTGSQLSPPHGTNKKLKCETKNKTMSMICLVQSHCHEGNPVGKRNLRWEGFVEKVGFEPGVKTTKQNRKVRTGRSKAEVTNNKKIALEILCYLKLTTDRHEASCDLFAIAELLALLVNTAAVCHLEF